MDTITLISGGNKGLGHESARRLKDALFDEDFDALREELGDVLLQMVFYARLAEENEAQPPIWSTSLYAGTRTSSPPPLPSGRSSALPRWRRTGSR